jgi:hypothetical protein
MCKCYLVYSALITNCSMVKMHNADPDPADPDPADLYVFGPPGSGSGSIRTRYGSGSGSGSFYHQEKIVRKTLISTVL